MHSSFIMLLVLPREKVRYIIYYAWHYYGLNQREFWKKWKRIVTQI